MSMVSPEQFEEALYLGPVWVSTVEAARLCGLTKSGFHETPIKRGLVRAMKDPESGHTLILRDDVAYVYHRRAASKNERGQASYESLSARGIFPQSCGAMNGYELVMWAKAHAPDLLKSSMAPPSTMTVGRHPSGEEVRSLITLETLAGRLDRVDRLVESLLAIQGVETSYSKLADHECLALITDCKAALGTRFEPAELNRRSRMLLRLSAEHLAQIRSWSLFNTAQASQLLDEHELPYLCLLDLARELVLQSRALPGSDLRLSAHYRVLAQAEKAHQHMQSLVRAQTAADLLLYRQDHGGYLPAPLCATDRFILSCIVPKTSFAPGT